MIDISDDIRKNVTLAFRIGLNIPEMHLTSNLTDEQVESFRSDSEWEIIDELVILKKLSDIDFDIILPYFNGRFYDQVIAINDRYLLSGGMGGELPANLVTMFPGKVHIPKQLQLLHEFIQEQKPDYDGFIALSLTYDNKKLWYRHISFALTPDYFEGLQNLYQTSALELLHGFRDDKPFKAEGISTSCRIYAYPYTSDNNIDTVVPFADALGLKFIDDCFIHSYHRPKIHIKDTWREMYSIINNPQLKHAGIVYNPDGAEKARMVFNVLSKNKVLK